MSSAANFDRMIMAFMRDDPMTAYYIKEVAGPYDTSTGEAPVVRTEIPVSAILLDLIGSVNGFSTKYGTLIQAGDKELYVLPPNKSDPLAAPLDVDPANDRIRINTITYKIVAMKEANPDANMPLLYNFMLRR